MGAEAGRLRSCYGRVIALAKRTQPVTLAEQSAGMGMLAAGDGRVHIGAWLTLAVPTHLPPEQSLGAPTTRGAVWSGAG